MPVSYRRAMFCVHVPSVFGTKDDRPLENEMLQNYTWVHTLYHCLMAL